MFHRLIASQPRSAGRWPAGSGIAAFLAHGAVVAAAVWGTLRPGDRARAAAPPVVIAWPERPDASAPRAPRLPVPVFPEPDPVPIPVTPDVPPIDASKPFDRAEWVRGAGDRGVVTPPAGDADGPWTPVLIDEQPALLAGRPPAYPEQLRSAGVEGRVVVQAVIDTLGRAEPGATVVESSHPGFEAPGLEYVRRALFRPGRMHGRPVRVLIRLPVDFRLTRVQ